MFPLAEFSVKMGWLGIRSEEWLWCISDFLGKVVFSSSLLQGNFITADERRRIAMKAIEEANRSQVIQELKALVEHKEVRHGHGRTRVFDQWLCHSPM